MKSVLSRIGKVLSARKLWILPIVGFLALVSWAYASPSGASPDDNFHLVSIWCGQGDRTDYCEPLEGRPEIRQVPMWVSGAACYAYNPESSAECQTPDYGSPTQLVHVDYGNFNHVYPPFFYWFMSLFTGPNTIISVLLMRIINAAIFIGMLSFTYWMVPERLKRPVLWGAVFTSVPLALFVIPSTNPSSWAVTSAATLWALLIALYEATTSRRRVLAGGLALVAAVIGSGARADAAIFNVLAILVAIFFTIKRRTRPNWIAVAFTAAIVLLSAAFYLSAGQSLAAAEGLNGTPPSLSERIYLLVVNVLQVPMIWSGVFGSWGLGWLDTAMPAIVSVGSVVIVAGLAFWGVGIRQISREDSIRKALVVLGVFAAFWMYPTLVLVQTGAMAGGYFQPRYVLPVAIVLLGVTLVGARMGSAFELSTPQRVAVIFFMAVANSMAIHANMRRYITGTDHQNWNLSVNAEWWWPGAWFGPMVLWAVSSLAFFAVLWIATSRKLETTAHQ